MIMDRVVEGDGFSSQDLWNQASELFNCSICLELVYKPVVHACGHVFCFWCTHQVMDCEKQSQCPVCRQPYMYFPRVCKLLHSALTKAVPQEYKRRGCEIQGEEEEHQIFSPFFPQLQEIPQACAIAGPGFERGASNTNDAVTTSNANASVGINGHYNVMESCENEDLEYEQRIQRNSAFIQSVLSVDDFRCSACNDLLYRPVVLNCGDVLCEICLMESNSKALQCPSCTTLHPAGHVQVCLALHQYLESCFPVEYSRKQLQMLEENKVPINYNSAAVEDCKLEGDLHVAVGCDGCGMFPILGDRYRCEECTEIIGFDLCGSCYSSGGSLLGRFNQKHQLNHRMEQVKTDVVSIYAQQD